MTKKEFEECELIQEAIQRGIIEIKSERVTYNLNKKKSYSWSDPEEWVRAKAVAFLTLKKSYAPNCIRTEVTVPRRTPEDLADIVVYEDNKCQNPYLVVETKKEKISERQRKQAIEQLFGNANSLRIPLALYENNEESILYDVLNFPSTERNENIKGNRDAVPEQYGKIPEYTFIAGPGNNDIIPATKNQLELKVKRAHSIIWAGGKRDPLLSFDEWSKIMFASLENFVLSKGKDKIASEHIMIERAIEFLAPGGKFAIVLPDGIFNNQGENSNCPLVRRYLVKNGFIKAVVSLPDHAFRKSGAQNKTSILFFQKFTREEKEKFDEWYWDSVNEQTQEQENFDAINIPLNVEEIAIDVALEKMNYQIFMAEANYIGYNSVGNLIINNDLYKGAIGGHLDDDQANTILGEFRRFETESNYQSETTNCIALSICKVWREHVSHRIDPKYHLFVNNEQHDKPNGWKHKKVCELMERRLEIVKPEEKPDEEVIVMTLKQTGDIIPREAGKGKNPPEWLGMYFEDSASTWYKAYKGDLVYSSIDMWKGCISVVPNKFDGALVTKEFPIYKMKSNDILPDFLALLLRSRYYQKAFRAITTGHSNRRRTQSQDFESIEIWYPEDKKVQEELMKDYLAAKNECYESTAKIKKELYRFSNYLDGLGEMEYEIASEDLDNEV